MCKPIIPGMSTAVIPTKIAVKKYTKKVREEVSVNLLRAFTQRAIKNGVIKKPNIYPPVGLKRFVYKVLNPENTGSPTTPRRRYTTLTAMASAGLSNNPARIIAKVCRVKGTPEIGFGIDTQAHTHIKAANIAINVILFVDKKGFFIVFASEVIIQSK